MWKLLASVILQVLLLMILIVTKDIFAGPDDMPAHIKSSMFGCQLTYGFPLFASSI